MIQDADLEYDPEKFPRLIEPIVRGETNVVYGSRYLGRQNELPLWRDEIEAFYTLIRYRFVD